MNLIDFGMGLQEAGDAPRIHHDGSTEPAGQALPMNDGGEVQLESGFPYRTIQGLMDRGHKVTWANGPFGGYQAIRRDLKRRVRLSTVPLLQAQEEHDQSFTEEAPSCRTKDDQSPCAMK